MKLILESYMAEFVTIYDEENKEIAEFQSDEIINLECAICNLLDYLNIEYEWKNNEE